jgi:hypothetical protein
MTSVNYTDVPVNANGQATLTHLASHHVEGIPGAGEATLCGQLITYATWKGTAPGAARCPECERMDG